jgi:ABC-type nitrate/sulfonate/bicarbonate transport system permease component
VAIVVAVAAWQVVTAVFGVPAFLLPSPLAVAGQLAGHWRLLLGQALVTGGEIVAGFAIGAVAGIPLAVLLSHSRPVERAVYPLIVGSEVVPKVAIAPLLLAWFGYGVLPKLIIVALMTFFPIVVNTLVGLKSLSPQMLFLARSMGADRGDVFLKFQLPNALPSLFAGLKVGIVLATVGAVVAEFVGADAGLGYVIMMATADFDIARQFAAIMVLAALGIGLFAIVRQAERVCLAWHVSVRGDAAGD